MFALPRRREPELMDGPLSGAEHFRALAGLARLNRLSPSASAFRPALRRLAAKHPGRPLRVLDVATGGGDTPFKLLRWARREGIALDMHACDLSPVAMTYGVTGGDPGGDVHFFRHDAVEEPLPGGYDAALSSLFLHHLDPPEARKLLSNMARAAGAVLVNDLHRGRGNLALVWLGCQLVSRSRVVHTDGPRSVRGAYTPAEARQLAAEAGLAGATTRGLFPCRYLLEWGRA